jgi:hypothetical protein
MLFSYLGGLKLSVLSLGRVRWLMFGSEKGFKEVDQTAECLQERWIMGSNFPIRRRFMRMGRVRLL